MCVSKRLDLDLAALPKRAQDELYDFYLFLKQRYQREQPPSTASETALLSEQNLREDWNKKEEDQVWQAFQ
ncbi:MAG: DUF2281 domain-containing protein [Cellvibrionales bacterium]|nr:DUF2281 domain-containing protein [Cellvibrionales bacterium]